MEFESKLQHGRIVDIYKSLITDVELDDGSVVPVFCPEGDNGRNLCYAGAEVFAMRNRETRRKLRYECQLLNRGEGLIMVNPHYNTDSLIFEEAKSGLEFFCYGCKIDKKSVAIANKMKINYQS